MKTLLQIIPQAPSARGGVADYAINLARALKAQFQIATVFAIPNSKAENAEEFPARPMETAADGADHTLLHYTNYGYQHRGVPNWLPPFLKTLPRHLRLTTFFHELYASSASLLSSAFWLQPQQKRVAREIAQLSNQCLISNPVGERQLRALAPAAKILLQPVASNFGEPDLSRAQISERDPHRWVICGGTAILRRSLRSFTEIISNIPEAFAPHELLLLGGARDAEIQRAGERVQKIRVTYRPDVSAAAASELLTNYPLGWIDYVDRKRVPLEVVLKSSSVAAYLAHGIIPVFCWGGQKICADNDCLPGPFFIGRRERSMPEETKRAAVGEESYNWYCRQSAVSILAKKIASFVATEN